MKIATVVGARPQFVKAAVVSRALRDAPDIAEVMIHTGQHYDEGMSGVFFRELDIAPPHHSLEVGSGSHGWQTGRMLELVEKVFLLERPDWVIVYGDTNSTLAGAVAASKLHIPLAHVEAGLRSFNRLMPEEINRVLTDHASDLLLAPTSRAVANLAAEGFRAETVVQVGDVMYDAALFYADRAQTDILQSANIAEKSYVLATIHRAENTDDERRLANIVDGLIDVADDVPVVWPIHPRTRARLDALGWTGRVEARLHLVAAVGYLEMIALEKSARAIVTDSGGVQKEAFFFRIPCCTLRSETEWGELVELGWNRLCAPTSRSAVRAGVLGMFGVAGSDLKPYGDGNAGQRVVAAIVERAGRLGQR